MKQEKIVTDSWKVHVNSTKYDIIDTTLYDVKYIWNNSFLNCGCRWKWRMIIAVNFQFKQLERRSLKKIRASTGFEPVTSALPVRCSTNWAMKPHIESEVNLLRLLLSNCLKWKIYCYYHSSLWTTLYVHGWFLFWHLYTGMAYVTS